MNTTSAYTHFPVSNQDDDMQSPISLSCEILEGQSVVAKAAQTVNEMLQMDIPRLHQLVYTWRQTKINLPLAEPLVEPCVNAVLYFHQAIDATEETGAKCLQQAKMLVSNTRRRIVLSSDSKVGDFFNQITGENIRWETLGIFFTAAAKAAIDVPYFSSLYTNAQQRWALIRALMYLGDCCLECCLQLDCLNDLQIVLQFENLVQHTQVDGDQSKCPYTRVEKKNQLY